MKFATDMYPRMADVTAGEDVQIQINHDGTVIWVHVGGLTVLRCSQIRGLDIHDGRVPIKEGATK